jgi:DNA-binding transcriptional LysR family regulator
MWLASEMAAFAHVCELRSFTAAARLLGVPKVAVSRAIVSLERRLGTRVLIRTTRRVSLTPAGELLRPYCQRLLVEVEAVRARFASAPDAPGRLRLLVDAGYGRLLVTPLVPRFLERYGDVALSVAVVDSLPTAPSDQWDLLICNAAREPGTAVPVPGVSEELIRTPLGRPSLLLCATPAYLAQHGRPRKPADLTAHTVLRPSGGLVLRLRRRSEERGAGRASQAQAPPAEAQELRVRPTLQVDDPALVHSSAAAGLGIGVLPEFLCRQGLAMGKLERVLPDWIPEEPLELQALHAAGPTNAVAVRQFLEFLLANMVPVLGTGSVTETPVRRAGATRR